MYWQAADVNVPSKSYKQKNFGKKNLFFVAPWQPLTKKQDPDPDPDPY